jgi:hypothetical protein
MGRDLEEIVVASYHIPGRTEGKNKNLQSY